MPRSKIKKGDTVRVIAGRDKHAEGKVIAVNHTDQKIKVEGVNMITKHVKATPQNQHGGIQNQEGTINMSNVMLLHKGDITRVGFKIEDGKKVRYAKSTGEVID
jgi:large subunit ribosomal protein L24